MSFSRAALELGISQPAVSLHIRELEKQCCRPLFIRHGSYIELSPFGQEILPLIQEIIIRYEKLNERIALQDELLHRPLRLGATPILAKYLLPTLIATLRKTYPSLGVELLTLDNAAITDALNKRQIDFGLSDDEDPYDGLVYDSLFFDLQILVTASGAATSVPAQSLNKLPLISEKELGSIEAVISYLKHSDSYAFLPMIAIREELQTRRIRRVLTDTPPARRQYYLVYRPDETSDLKNLLKNLAQQPV